jgi:hypothetical protein
LTEAALAEWAAFYAIDPPLEVRVDVGFAQLCALTAEMHRDKKKRPSPFTIQDFLSQWDKANRPNKLDPNVVRAKMMQAFGRKAVRKPRAKVSRDATKR